MTNRTRLRIALALSAASIAVTLANVLFVSVRAPAPPVDPPPPAAFAEGWVERPDEVAAVESTLPVKRFSDTPAFRAARGDGDVFLWDAAKKVTGAALPARDQGGVGSCVAFGTAAAVEHLVCVQLAEALNAGQPPPGEFRAVSTEVIYAGSRVEVGGGRIGGDGSVGAWAADWCRKWGVVSRAVHGRHDLTRYDEARCRAWGRTGVPDDLEPIAKQSPVKSVTLARTWPEVRAAVENGYPLIVCSSQGFTMQRDGDGFCRPSGRWMHCMAIVGVRGGARPGAFIVNSWGPNAHTGPRFPADAPVAGFWADASVVGRMAAQGDTWAFADAVGFPARSVDWFARKPAPREFARPLTLLGVSP